MKLSTKSRYAVMALVDLAMRTPSGKPVTLSEIAEGHEISLSYLEQLFAKLRRYGLVRSVRGPGGGYVLARAADAISVAEIVRAVDAPDSRPRRRSGERSRRHRRDGRCGPHAAWEKIENKIYDLLGTISLHDICEDRIPGTARMSAGPVAAAAE